MTYRYLPLSYETKIVPQTETTEFQKPSGFREDIVTPSLVGTPAGLLGQPGIVAGIAVTGHMPSGLLSMNRNATTTSRPEPNPDLSLNNDTMRVVSVEPFVLIQKSDGVHFEYIYDSGVVSGEEYQNITVPKLVPGGVIFRNLYDAVRVYALGDGGVIAGLPTSSTLAFVLNNTRYLADKNDVYFFTNAQSSVMQTAKDITIAKLPNADPKTFAVLYPEANFSKDKTHYFLNGETVADMSTEKVKPLPKRNDPPYDSAVDSVYFDDTYLYKIGFVMNPSEQYSGVHYKDHGTMTKELLKNIYYRKITDINPEREQVTRYAIGRNDVFYNDRKIINAKNSRFELIVGLLDFYQIKGGITYEYARDDISVYYRGIRVENADRDTLLPLPLNPTYASDKTHVFFDGKIIPNADPATFEPLWFPIYEGCLLGAYAKDTHAVFYKNQKVEDADTDSFRAKYGEYGQYKKGIYFQGIFQKELNPKKFIEPACGYG